MKTVFIFGAGASRPAGGPLMSDFFDKAEHLARNKLAQAHENDFENVFNAIAELQPIHAKSYFDLDNLEMLFGAIEMGNLIQKFANRSQEEIKKLRESMIWLIVVTLENSIQFRFKNGIKPALGYNELAQKLSKARRDGTNYGFITFNYDIALDHALNSNNISTEYYLNGSIAPTSAAVPLLKLHGSMNWLNCTQCNEIVAFPVNTIFSEYASQLSSLRFDVPNYINIPVNALLSTKVHARCSHALQGPPVLVPPTWDKSSHHKGLGNVWTCAARELANADNIIVIGYSLPDSDLFFRYLFSLGTESKTRIKKFWVFDPDTTGKVERNFRSLIGRGLENRFKFYQKTFEDSISDIETVLNDS